MAAGIISCYCKIRRPCLRALFLLPYHRKPDSGTTRRSHKRYKIPVLLDQAECVGREDPADGRGFSVSCGKITGRCGL